MASFRIHRDYFKTAANTLDPKILQVSAPFKTTNYGGAFTLSRTLLGPTGEFAGMVIVLGVILRIGWRGERGADHQAGLPPLDASRAS
jgi:hypothetical protein